MGWKDRGGRAYYYRTAREGARVRTAYVGKGPAAELIAAVEAEGRRARAERAEADRAERARLEAADRAAMAGYRAIGQVMALALESAGFIRHKRGEWRMATKTRAIRPGDPAPVPAEAPAGPPAPAPLDEIRQVVDLASEGDRSALPRLRELFRQHPEQVMRIAGGDLAGQAAMAIIDKLGGGGKNLVWGEAIPRKMIALRRELAGPDPSAVEVLLVERIVFTWLEVYSLDFRFAQAEDVNFALADQRGRMRDRAHRRYLSAIKALATVRGLGPAAVRVNIGAQQIVVQSRPDREGIEAS